ncbi:MAG: Grx4 family monothiol glutaredoxin [Verrucomicrobiaceae bacterium]|nr:MAG: Grx4 family monothiol glutaredoxin [Verrucomicrobiaceae bacterium]
MNDDTRKKIQGHIDAHRVLLFMKGTRQFPQCGFSARVVEALKRVGAEFETVNVLADPEVREGIKEFSNWPTIPQLYIDQKLVGGCDIALQLFQSGELTRLIKGDAAAS